MSRVIELALNSTIFTRVSFLRYKINSDIRPVATIRPFIP